MDTPCGAVIVLSAVVAAVLGEEDKPRRSFAGPQ